MENLIWHRPQDEPEDRQACDIAFCQGWLCTSIVCNVPYFREAKIWIDLFATREAGESYGAEQVVAWTPTGLIPPVPAEFVKSAMAAARRRAAAEESANRFNHHPEWLQQRAEEEDRHGAFAGTAVVQDGQRRKAWWERLWHR